MLRSCHKENGLKCYLCFGAGMLIGMLSVILVLLLLLELSF